MKPSIDCFFASILLDGHMCIHGSPMIPDSIKIPTTRSNYISDPCDSCGHSYSEGRTTGTTPSHTVDASEILHQLRLVVYLIYQGFIHPNGGFLAGYLNHQQFWVFPKIKVPPKWMVKRMVPNPMSKWMIWGYHHFRKHPFIAGSRRWKRWLQLEPPGWRNPFR